MKIVVCVKHVPDTTTKIVIKDGDNWIDDSNVNYILNPYDEFAVEEAIKTKDKFGGEIVVISLGPERASKAIRNALAMGADSGVHLQIDGVFMGLSVAKTLAQEIKNHSPDIVFLGRQAIDDDNFQTGSMLGELLDMPAVSIVSKLDLTDSGGVAERDIEGGKEVVEFSFPAVITTQKGLNEPRYASLKGIMMAKKKPLEIKNIDTPESNLSFSKLEYPPQRGNGKILNNGADSVPELVKLIKDGTKVV